eukprot:CAMPEP_0204220044 /NCGR_PEP_ID=MMETSP0361-20130328/80717_1 /ASSEMBLY_ACC=CAM_ASM_000343 /TAXON_ID=268821 /ORGANISM="Scrippsiella Hangoei, Strain SHTV-5" /LENGTH=190 /DNA_ID=CAMNT_0051185407 /DNA_START=127 /DNA_END=699 /DNA_ORIENTATION=-
MSMVMESPSPRSGHNPSSVLMHAGMGFINSELVANLYRSFSSTSLGRWTGVNEEVDTTSVSASSLAAYSVSLPLLEPSVVNPSVSRQGRGRTAPSPADRMSYSMQPLTGAVWWVLAMRPTGKANLASMGRNPPNAKGPVGLQDGPTAVSSLRAPIGGHRFGLSWTVGAQEVGGWRLLCLATACLGGKWED